MNINVKNIEAELQCLNNLIEDYEDIYLNLYNEISSVSFFWQDKNEVKFIDNINVDKQKIRTTIEELISIREIYSCLVTNYQKIGNSIRCNLSAKNIVISRLDTYISKLNNTILAYNSLDFSFCTSIAPLINNQKNILIQQLKKAKKLKQSFQQKFNEIEKIEKVVSLKISKIKLEIIQEKTIV